MTTYNAAAPLGADGGVRLRHFRIMAGFAPEELARAARISTRQLRDIELGHREPQAETLLLLAAALGVEGDDFRSPRDLRLVVSR